MSKPIAQDDESGDELKKPGHIDLVGLFEAEAQELLSAVKRGRLLHGTRNIRDSGAPLEAKLRAFLAARLPFQYRVLQGYLFDVNSNCTPQVDAMVVNAGECHELMVSGEGATYLPFTSALVVFEVKNSARNIPKCYEQISAVTNSIRDMKNTLRSLRSLGGPMLPDLLSVLFFADSSDAKLSDFKNWYADHSTETPSYTVLLDRGLIIAKKSPLFDFKESDSLSFAESRAGSVPHLCAPKRVDDYRAGRVLLWLYFAIIAHVNLLDGNRRAIVDFAEIANNTYDLRTTMLSNVVDWDKATEPAPKK